MRAWWRRAALAGLVVLAVGATYGAVESKPAVSPPAARAVVEPSPAPVSAPEATGGATPQATPTPTATPSPTPPSSQTALFLGLQPGVGTRDDAFGQFLQTSWRTVFEALTTAEQTCIRGELGVTQLASALRGVLLQFISPLAPWHADFFRCLEPETALRVFIFWWGEGWHDVSENSLSCAREFLGPTDIADFLAGELPDATSESAEVSRRVYRGLLACNIQPLRGSLVNSISGNSEEEGLCFHTKVSEAVIASLLGRATAADAPPWQEQMLSCLTDSTVGSLLFDLLPTASGGVFRDEEDCVRREFTEAQIASGMPSRTSSDHAAARQALVDRLRTCIPDLELAGEDAHPVERRLGMWGDSDSSCINIEIGEAFLGLVLGKPYRPNPELVMKAQGCLHPRLGAAAFLALLSREIDGLTGDHQSCVRSHLADSRFGIFLLPDASPGSAPAFQEFVAGHRACLSDVISSDGDGIGRANRSPAPLWQSSTGGSVVPAPTVSGGVLYAGSDDAHVYALDTGTGELRWSFATGGAVRSSPTVADGVVYAGSDDAHLYALDAGTGELRWKFDTGDPVKSRPTVSGGMVFLSARDQGVHKLHAVNAASGERVWVAAIPIAFDPGIAPTVSGSRVFVASVDGDLYALHASTGEVAWTFDTPSPPAAQPVTAGGRVFLMTAGDVYAVDEDDGRMIWSDYFWSVDYERQPLPPLVVEDVVYVSSGRQLFGRDAATGQTVMVLGADGFIDTLPALHEGLVFIGSDGGQLYARDPLGEGVVSDQLIWGVDIGPRTLRHPVVANGILYAQSNDGRLEAFNAANGQLIWSLDLGERRGRRSFTVVENTVYVGSADGSVYALKTETPEVVEVTPTPVPAETPTPRESVVVTEIQSVPIQTSSMTSNDERAEISVGGGDSGLTLRARWELPDNSLIWGPKDSNSIYFIVGSRVYRIGTDGSSVEFVVDAATEMRRLAGREYQHWAFHAVEMSRDGASLVYSTFEHLDRARRGDLPGAFAYEIGSLQLDGSGRRQLTTNQDYDDYPAWSPDGSQVAFVQWDYDSGYGVAVVDVASGQETVVASGPLLPREAIRRQTPVWSPDGGHIAFVGYDRTEVRGPAIYAVGSDGSNLRLLTVANSRPAWTPDGKRLAFAKPDGDELALFTIAADGSDLQRVTKIELSSGRASYGNVNVERDEPGSSGYATSGGGISTDYEAMDPKDIWVDTLTWSPDGSMIMYGCGALICVAKADGTQIGTSPLGLRRGMTGAWSPDGTRIAIGRLELRRPAWDDGVALYTMAPDGSDLELLVRHDSEGDLHRLGVRPTVDQVSTAGCADGTAVANPADNPGLVRDCETLLSIRDVLAASPPLDWADDRPITSWEGVAIGGTPPRVRGLDVRHRGLSGVFPIELTALTQLRELDLSWNKLSGTIPPEIGALTSLTLLDLFANNLTGVIPKEIGNLSNLTFLKLDSMYLQGTIPVELGQLTQLGLLNLENNHLTGPIPLELTQLPNLRYLSLGTNRLTGPIPPELGNLRSLTGLNLEWNRLSGGIPAELGQISGLDRLRLSGNQLTGAIPSELGALSLMRDLFLAYNQLSGPIPETFGQFRHLWYLHLNDNQLTGPIPSSLGNLSEMSELYLYNNQLEGPIPPEIGRLKNLLYFVAHNNRLTGPIPAELSGLESLWTLSLSDNLIDGPIPPELGQMPSLRSLALGNNRLSGSIPPELAQLPNGYRINLQDNQLTGTIPAELGQMSMLEWLYLGGNQLTGEIPAEIGNLFVLWELDLSGNQLTGSIPFELGEMGRLNMIDLSDNLLTGTIPISLFGVLMDHVDLSNNQLTGPIPPEVGENFGLRRLDLSNNELTGPIPVSLGGVSYLQALLLHGNNLTGEVPQEFAGLFRLEEINLAGNQLSGCIPPALRFAVIHEFERLGLAYCEN
ncbi:MAG: PQQ-binding-like beta-propeller repeat protein [Chloroflexi bacterium]|nr:PQQ-binding-like beta-propeller repeat protein [Chloroflexota bacterium]